MDLALAVGRPDLEAFAHELTEREFYVWSRYAQQYGGLPHERIERLLAVIARAVEHTVGVSNPLSHYLPALAAPEVVEAKQVQLAEQVEQWHGEGLRIKGKSSLPSPDELRRQLGYG